MNTILEQAEEYARNRFSNFSSMASELRESFYAGYIVGVTQNNSGAGSTPSALATKHDVEEALKAVMATVLDGLNALEAKLDKATTDLQNELDTLETALNNAGTITPDVQASLDRLSAKADALDALKPSTAQVTTAGATASS